jgi:hypothetical protein
MGNAGTDNGCGAISGMRGHGRRDYIEIPPACPADLSALGYDHAARHLKSRGLVPRINRLLAVAENRRIRRTSLRDSPRLT